MRDEQLQSGLRGVDYATNLGPCRSAKADGWLFDQQRTSAVRTASSLQAAVLKLCSCETSTGRGAVSWTAVASLKTEATRCMCIHTQYIPIPFAEDEWDELVAWLSPPEASCTQRQSHLAVAINKRNYR